MAYGSYILRAVEGPKSILSANSWPGHHTCLASNHANPLLLPAFRHVPLVAVPDAEAASADGTPRVDVTIADCGVL